MALLFETLDDIVDELVEDVDSNKVFAIVMFGFAIVSMLGAIAATVFVGFLLFISGITAGFGFMFLRIHNLGKTLKLSKSFENPEYRCAECHEQENL